jgi:beta-lactamase regulating signal transducer with metallopeptidase domain
MTPTESFATWTLASLLRCSLSLIVAVGVVQLALHGLRVQSPRWHRLAWLVVLLQGWLWLGWTINVPFSLPRWLDASPSASTMVRTRQVPASDRPVTDLADHSTAAAPPPRERLVAQPNPATSADVRPATVSPPVPRKPLRVDRSQPRVQQTPADVLLVLWQFGALFCVVWGLGRYVRFVRQLPAGQTPSAEWREEWHALLLQSSVRSDVRLRVTAELGPLLVRVPLGYRLYVPQELWEQLTSTQRIAILRHELAHLERGDVWWSVFARLLALPQWFNPLAWYAVRRFDEAAEWACDDAVAAADPTARATYANALLSLGTPTPRYYALHPAAAGQPLAWRIRRLLSPELAFDSRFKRGLILVGLVALIGFGLLRFRSQPTPPPIDYPTADPASASQGDSVVPTDLKYDGKTFAQWKREYLTELNPDRRTEAVKAFAAFASSGYGKEAVDVLFDVVKDVDFKIIDSSPTGQLKQTTINALASLDSSLTIERVFNLLLSDRESDRYLGCWILSGGQGAISPGRFDVNIEFLVDAFIKSTDPLVRAEILRTFQRAGFLGPGGGVTRDNPHWLPTLLKGLQDENPGVVKTALGVLVPTIQQGGMGGGTVASQIDHSALEFYWEILYLLDHPDPEIQKQAIEALGTLGPKAAPAIQPLLERYQAIQGNSPQASDERMRLLLALKRISEGDGFWPVATEIAALPASPSLLSLVHWILQTEPVSDQVPPQLRFDNSREVSNQQLFDALKQAVAERAKSPPAEAEPTESFPPAADSLPPATESSPTDEEAPAETPGSGGGF